MLFCYQNIFSCIFPSNLRKFLLLSCFLMLRINLFSGWGILTTCMRKMSLQSEYLIILGVSLITDFLVFSFSYLSYFLLILGFLVILQRGELWDMIALGICPCTSYNLHIHNSDSASSLLSAYHLVTLSPQVFPSDTQHGTAIASEGLQQLTCISGRHSYNESSCPLPDKNQSRECKQPSSALAWSKHCLFCIPSDLLVRSPQTYCPWWKAIFAPGDMQRCI